MARKASPRQAARKTAGAKRRGGARSATRTRKARKPKVTGAKTAAQRRKPATPGKIPARRKPAAPPRFGRLHQVALKASDLDASVAFYRDVLGLALIARFDPPGLAFFDLDGTRLMLSPNSSEGTLYFSVRDLDALIAELTARGLALAAPAALVHRDEAGHFGPAGSEEWMAFFRDPSGNLLALATRK